MPNVSTILSTSNALRNRCISIRRYDLRRLITMLDELNELIDYNPVTGHDGCTCDECMEFDNKIEECIELLEQYIE